MIYFLLTLILERVASHGVPNTSRRVVNVPAAVLFLLTAKRDRGRCIGL